MNIPDYIRYIQQEMHEKKYRDDYIHAFSEYKEYLQAYIANHPEDLEAVCQLAAVLMEFNLSKQSVELLENYLLQYSNELIADDKARIYTNLSFFYNDIDKKDQSEQYLKWAVALQPKFPNAYNALALIYFATGQTNEARKLFSKACHCSDNWLYKFNFAVSLNRSGAYKEALWLFERLLTEHREKRILLYNLSISLALLGDMEKAVALADELAEGTEDEHIDYVEIANIYYLCGNYAKYNEMYDRHNDNNNYETIDWLACYLYALKMQNKMEEFNHKYAKILSVKEEWLKGAVKGTKGSVRQEKKKIMEAYNKILYTDYKPEVNIRFICLCNCYLIDCPKYQSITYKE